MAIKRIEKIDQFWAKSDSGNNYEINVFQEFIDASDANNPNNEIPGLKFMRTSDGMHINFIDSENFMIVELGITVHKI